MAKYRYKLKKNGAKPNPDMSDHVGSSGKVKKKMSADSAKSVAARTGMNAYRCAICGCFHVGRTIGQREADGWKSGRKWDQSIGRGE